MLETDTHGCDGALSLTGDGAAAATAAAAAAAGMDIFFACEIGVRGAVVARRGVVAAAAAGRVVAGRVVEADSEAREAAREGVVSVLERDVMPGRFVADVADSVALRSAAVLLGVARAAALVTVGGRRAVGVDFFLSSPDVTDERSGSASDALALGALEGWVGRRARVLAAGRAVGLVGVEAAAPMREAALAGERVAAVEAFAFALAALAVGRRTGWAPAVPPKVPRRGGAVPFVVAGEGDDEAMMRRRAEGGQRQRQRQRERQSSTPLSKALGQQQPQRWRVFGCGHGLAGVGRFGQEQQTSAANCQLTAT
jgi:hypothetical protein